MNETMQINVDKHSNMLIIGKASLPVQTKEISFEDDYDTVIRKYGDSDLAKAFKIAKDAGVEYIFLMNIQNSYEYLEITDMLQQNDFTYIVPVNLYLSDTYDDAYNNNRTTSYIGTILSKMRDCNESVFVVTDKHASLYEDIDSFLKAMNTVESTFLTRCPKNVDKENLIFVANNLEKDNMANVTLASALCTTEINTYPTGAFGTAIFDIDGFDEIGNYAYFKNHAVRDTTVENLLNFLPSGIEKIVTISRIIKVIKRELDFSDFTGKLYSAYQLIRIRKKLETYLGGLVGYAITKYNIVSVQPYRETRGTIIVKNIFEVWPINSLEKCTISKGVEIG